MKSLFEGLSPIIVWDIFEQILSVPRPSKREGAIRLWLRCFAEDCGLSWREDFIGNIVIVKPASAGYEGRAGIVLQSHMDMVCEKDSGVEHDFMKDPIDAYVEDGWVKARGTTLGADCGIGMALQLAVLKDNTLQHPRIEALFTVDEEQGLTGAMNLGDGMLTGKYLINLDSEDEGEIYIGCAGGIDTVATFKTPVESLSGCYISYIIEIKGLLGGHSGDDINKGRACANKLLSRFLISFCVKGGGLLCGIDGGNLRNAIAREARAVIAVPMEDVKVFETQFEGILRGIVEEFSEVEQDMDIEFKETPTRQEMAIERMSAIMLINALQAVPHGVVAMSNAMPGLVETSTNLASVKQKEGITVVTTSQRSSILAARNDIATTVAAIFKLAGADVEHSDGYPGWKPNPNSLLVRKSVDVYNKIFSKQPRVKAIHAGLECGLIIERNPDMEAISIGPTLRGVHSPLEKIDIYTVELFWIFLVRLIKDL